MKRIYLICGMLFSAALVFGQAAISGNLEWDKMEIQARVSLDLASANIKLPAGRTQGELILSSEYLRLVQPHIRGLQVDSYSTVADLIQTGIWNLADAEEIARSAHSVPPFLSPDLLRLESLHTINLEDISSSLLRHTRPAEIRRTLSPVPTPPYTGIIIIASSALPVHGMKSPASIVPCLFPKIWDTDMNLIFERNMLERGKKIMARYAPRQSIFYDSPSGLSPEISQWAGDRPLRIIARGLFGNAPTDLIIDAEDALSIISTEENRRLLREGRVLIIVDDKALKIPFNG